MEHQKIIAQHETGHFLALYAAGLYPEFTFISCNPTDVEGQRVDGVTLRNGKSLLDYSNQLQASSMELCKFNTVDADKRKAIVDSYEKVFVDGLKIALPHIAFYFGGGSYDRFIGAESVTRNSIDIGNIREKVLPALQIVNVSNCDLAELQDITDAFLHKVFAAEKGFMEFFVECLEKEGSLEKEDMDSVLRQKQWQITDEVKAWYDEYLAAFTKWCNGKRLDTITPLKMCCSL